MRRLEDQLLDKQLKLLSWGGAFLLGKCCAFKVFTLIIIDIVCMAVRVASELSIRDAGCAARAKLHY